MKKKVKDIIKNIEAQSAYWTNYVKSLVNECAYTDSVIENIIKKAVELAVLTGNENLLESKKENHLLEFLKEEVPFRFKNMIDTDYELSDKDMEDIAQSLYDNDTDFIFDYDMFDKLLIEKAEAIFMSRTDSQVETIRRVCKELKMDDIQVKFDTNLGCIVATDNQKNRWLDKEIYEFLINECLGWNADGSLQEGFGYETKAIKKLTEDAEKYGVKKELAEE